MIQAILVIVAAMASAPEPFPASVAAALQRFEDAVRTERDALRTMPADTAVARNLHTRVALEQAMRMAMEAALEPLSDADRGLAQEAVWTRIGAVDAANTTYLKSVLPPDGWFRARRDGAETARNAWLIVQHSPDQRLQRTVVARMRPLVASGDASGSHYALLYDRTRMFAGQPQLYGSQFSCVAGRWQLAPLAAPATLDRRRARMGLEPMAEYRKNFADRC